MSSFFKIIISTLFYSVYFSHLYIFLFNPGLPSRNLLFSNFVNSFEYKKLSLEDKKNYGYCHICNILLPPNLNIEHCEDCNICIINYDHHCVWTGKCIAKNNIFTFYIFAFGGLVHSFLFFILIFYGLVNLGTNQ